MKQVPTISISSSHARLFPGIVENVIQRLTDIFHKQPSAMQEMMYCRLMSIKSSLYRCSTSGQQRAADCQAKLLLNSIATAFKSVLRPKNLSSQDMVSSCSLV